MDSETRKAIRKASRNQEPVVIYHNNDSGKNVYTANWLYAVILQDDPDFWLDAFPTKKQAVAFCREHKLFLVFE